MKNHAQHAAILTCALLAFGGSSRVFAGIVEDTRQALDAGHYPQAVALVQQYRKAHGSAPDGLEAMSWLARSALSRNDLAAARQWAEETNRLCVAELKKRPLDRDPNAPLALALGASIEVEGAVLERAGRGQGETYLRQQLQLYSRTSIHERIQKNINLLSMVGKPAPLLHGAAIPAGKVALLFFWAHWCPDCKAEADAIHRLKQEYGAKGFVVISPTQLYGYASGGDDATPAVESRYIEQVRQRYYAGVVDAPALINQENFNLYGASTTPTLVLVDRKGVVRMFHPGALPYAELRARIAAIL
jgi:thiol-disulfide isomerase/thioredoxin